MLGTNYFEDGFWDSSVFSGIQAMLGGRVRMIMTGSAPISAETLEFLRIVFACNVHEGYGMTECSLACNVTLPSDCSTGHVGPPAPTCEQKLVSVPEMGYTTEDTPNPRGEICVRGPTVFQGYYKQPDKTKEAFASGDEWLHTGDIGEWRPDGTLRIIDRKKALFKLAQGEYIAPDRIENVLTLNRFIGQAFVHGDSLQASIIAVVVPDRDALEKWAVAEGVGEKDSDDVKWRQLCESQKTNAMIVAEITAASKTAGLKGFEMVKAVHVEPTEFSVENNLMTPTFKVRGARGVVWEGWQRQSMHRARRRDLSPYTLPSFSRTQTVMMMNCTINPPTPCLSRTQIARLSVPHAACCPVQLKRHELVNKYRAEIDGMYTNMASGALVMAR